MKQLNSSKRGKELKPSLLISEYKLAVNRRKLIERIEHKFTSRKLVRKSRSKLKESALRIPEEIPDLLHFARYQHAQVGYFPISFSTFASKRNNAPKVANQLLSGLIPGEKYSFDVYEEYVSEYARSHFAITHKKGGWDCYRHIEILEQNTVPLMHDAGKCPDNSLFYFPKEILVDIYNAYLKAPFKPSKELLDFLESWFDRYLTAEASIRNMFSLAIPNFDRERAIILFVDNHLAHSFDYLSGMVLSGLSSVFPDSLYQYNAAPDFMYSDFSGNSANLYGRGFGYSRVLDPSTRKVINQSEIFELNPDVIVVGSAIRNREIIESALCTEGQAHLFLVEGRDEPIDEENLSWLLNIPNSSLFVREGRTS